MIKLLLVILFSSSLITANSIINSDYEEEDSLENYDDAPLSNTDDDLKLFRLNEKLELKCPNISDLSFREILFNRSLSDFNSLLFMFNKPQDYEISNDLLRIKSEHVFERLFHHVLKLQLTDDISQLFIQQNAKYSHSGHYYCVYTNNFNEYLIKSYLVTVYDEEILRKNFNETVELLPCIDKEDQNSINQIDWKSNDEHIKLNNKTLQLKLNHLLMFDTIYRCQNTDTGAYKLYSIECLNREDLNPEPLVFPAHQIVSPGSKTIFTCDKSTRFSREPDRYQWFMDTNTIDYENSTNDKIIRVFNLDLRKTIGDGPVLELNNLTRNDSASYICCLFYSKESPTSRSAVFDVEDDNADLYETNQGRLKNSFEYACSGGELNVQDFKEESLIPKVLSVKTKVLIALIIIVSCLILIVGIFFLAYYGYSKYFTYLKTIKAAQTMHRNDFYQSSSQDSSSRPGRAFNLDSKLDHFKQILTTSSSIESLLNKEDIKKWRIPIKDLTFGHVIGRGAFGVVIYAELKRKQTIALSTHSIKRVCIDTDSGLDSEVYLGTNTTTLKNEYSKPNGASSVVVTKNLSVAIKQLPENATSENFLDLFKELNLMFQVGQHSHIINLIGYSIEDSSLYIITDYARHGNLKDFLRKYHEMSKTTNTNVIIGPDTLLLYSYQVALGMQYLHSKKVLHRDLAARNILVDDYDSIKIADFGLARNIRTDYYYVQQREGKMPLKWMSPEALSFNRISNESDIWSYGILLWEIYTYGSTPYPSIQAENILANLNSGYRMEKPSDCDQYIYDEIILNCWRLEAKKRPTFSQLVELFNTSDYLNIKGLIGARKQDNSDQSSQSTIVTNASKSESSLSITNTPVTQPTPVENIKELNSSSNFLLTSSSSSSYNPSTSISSVNSPEQAYISSSSIFFEDTFINEKLLEKRNSSLSNNELKLIKENNTPKSNKHTRIKTTKTSIRKFAYRTNERKNSFGLMRNFKNEYNDGEYEDHVLDNCEEKKLLHRYNLLSEKTNFLNKNIISSDNDKHSNNNKSNNNAEKKKFLLTYV